MKNLALPALPDSFRKAALALPRQVDKLLARIDAPKDAQHMDIAIEAALKLAKQLKMETPVLDALQYARLKVVARIGELVPGKEGRPRKGEKKPKGGLGFSAPTLATYRKVARNKAEIDAYYQARQQEQEPSDVGMSIAGFVRFVTRRDRAAKDASREAEQNRAMRRIAKAKTIQDALKAAKFSTIVVDPPWDWDDEGDVSQFGRGRTTYGAMSHKELLAFPIGDYKATNAHLYLWITNRSLPKGFSLLEAWGFRYVTCLTWCKPSIGMGNYFRGSTEHILFGISGSLSLKRKDVGTWFSAPRGKKHSTKPDAAYELIESCSPPPYLDVFSRRYRKGWVCWGGELWAAPEKL